jgi:hypothetical protein
MTIAQGAGEKPTRLPPGVLPPTVRAPHRLWRRTPTRAEGGATPPIQSPRRHSNRRRRGAGRGGSRARRVSRPRARSARRPHAGPRQSRGSGRGQGRGARISAAGSGPPVLRATFFFFFFFLSICISPRQAFASNCSYSLLCSFVPRHADFILSTASFHSRRRRIPGPSCRRRCRVQASGPSRNCHSTAPSVSWATGASAGRSGSTMCSSLPSAPSNPKGFVTAGGRGVYFCFYTQTLLKFTTFFFLLFFSPPPSPTQCRPWRGHCRVRLGRSDLHHRSAPERGLL